MKEHCVQVAIGIHLYLLQQWQVDKIKKMTADSIHSASTQ